MPKSFTYYTQRLQSNLVEQAEANLYRNLEARQGAQGPEVCYQGKTYLSFASNDYLGLAKHPQLIQAFKDAADRYGVGSASSQVVSGHCDLHQALEEEIADFF